MTKIVRLKNVHSALHRVWAPSVATRDRVMDPSSPVTSTNGPAGQPGRRGAGSHTLTGEGAHSYFPPAPNTCLPQTGPQASLSHQPSHWPTRAPLDRPPHSNPTILGSRTPSSLCDGPFILPPISQAGRKSELSGKNSGLVPGSKRFHFLPGTSKR